MRKILRKIAREITLKWRIPGRYILERKIFPKIKNRKILIVGCAHYTKDYPNKLKKNKVWTIDIDPNMAKYGSKNHIIDSISNIDRHFKKNFFNIIFLIGVFGYGLNDKKEAEKTMKNCYKVLQDKGLLIIQWTDLPKKNPIDPLNLKNFRLFTPRPMFGYSSLHKISNKSSIWNFLVKLV